MILDDIIRYRREQLRRDMERISPDEMKKAAENTEYKTVSFKKALSAGGLSLIAEVKKASPSKGLIQPNFEPVRVAREYEKAGASAVSVLTEEHYFQGSIEYLKEIRKNIRIPILRKDFIFDDYQVYEARAAGADAILLIAASLDDSSFAHLYSLAHSLSLDVLSEAHDENEVKRLVSLGADIIGVNNRDLKTFVVSLENSKRLMPLIPEDTVKVCESGLKTADDLRAAAEYGADAVLVGETLMRNGIDDIGSCIDRLLKGDHNG